MTFLTLGHVTTAAVCLGSPPCGFEFSARPEMILEDARPRLTTAAARLHKKLRILAARVFLAAAKSALELNPGTMAGLWDFKATSVKVMKESGSVGCVNLPGEGTSLERRGNNRAESSRRKDSGALWRHTPGEARAEQRQGGSEFRGEIGVASWRTAPSWGQRFDKDESADAADRTRTVR